MSIKKKFDLGDSIALITGGAGLLGLHHTRAIIEGNGRPVLLDIVEDRMNQEIEKLRFEYKTEHIYGYRLDISDEQAISETVKKIIKDLGRIDILINNVANNPDIKKGYQHLTRLENFPLERWNEDIIVGLTGAFLMSKHVGFQMAKNKKGVIVNIASDLGIIAPDQRIYKKDELPEDQQPVKPVTYSVIKHGLIGLTKYLATYWADKGIRVNALSPGGVFGVGLKEDFVEKLTNLIPMGRMASADEYQSALLFLCSDASSYMTGANLVIDGGRTCW